MTLMADVGLSAVHAVRASEVSERWLVWVIEFFERPDNLLGVTF